MTGTYLAFDGSGIDGGLYTRILRWAERAPHWLDRSIEVWSVYGVVVFALLMLYAWWQARGAGPAVMARVLASPLIVIVAYLANGLLKDAVQEVRPCRQIPGSVPLEACPGAGDWSFPSNHTVVAFAAAAALWFAYRRIGWVALLFAVLMGASRVWVGVHYPHDVVVGALVGVAVAAVLALLAGRLAVLIVRLRGGPLGTFLGNGTSGGSGSGAGAVVQA